MTVQRCRFGKLSRSDVKQILFVVVLLTILDYLPLKCHGQELDRGKVKNKEINFVLLDKINDFPFVT